MIDVYSPIVEHAIFDADEANELDFAQVFVFVDTSETVESSIFLKI